jgi:DMSO/TMAO reductase YedYZ molybdopterin-dependent catalytic subunit
VVDGVVNRALRLSCTDLAAIPDAEQIPEVAEFHPGRNGRGVELKGLLRMADPRPDAAFLTLHSGRDDFHVSIPLAEIRDRGMIVYKQGDAPLRLEKGGPFRFLIRDPASCHSADLDECANVKYLSRIELTVEKGPDTRPEDDDSHAALHAHQEGNLGANGIRG